MPRLGDTDYVRIADQFAELHEARIAELDEAASAVLYGIRWSSVDGEPSPEHACWAKEWSEILCDLDSMPWALQAHVYRCLGELPTQPFEGEAVRMTLAAVLVEWCGEEIYKALREALL